MEIVGLLLLEAVGAFSVYVGSRLWVEGKEPGTVYYANFLIGLGFTCMGAGLLKIN
jgi:hypothetical protein